MSTDMLTDVPMPQMGVAVTEGTIVAWHVAVGDTVEVEQAICDIATDKVDTEVLSPSAGVVAELVGGQGDTIAVGEPIARLSPYGSVAPATSDGPAVSDTPAEGPDSAGPAPQTPGSGGIPAGNGNEDAARVPVKVALHASDLLAGADIDPPAAADAVLDRPNGRGAPLSSPVARRIAADRGVDLATVRGTGRRGRIRKADVLAAGEVPQAAPAAPVAPADPFVRPPAAREGGLPVGYEDVPHEIVTTSPTRRAISEHMIRSRRTAAHMTTEVEVDMHRVSAVRKEINAAREAAAQGRVSFLSFIARAAVTALAEFPELNATFEHERSIRWREVNLGVAVDTPAGLIAPVIRGVDRLTVGAIADAIVDLADRAQARKLTADDLRAGTFTISNPGSVGAVSAAAIINQPQVAILGTPTIVRRPWVVTTPDGAEAIVPRPIMKLALTFDHRAVDGANATRYLVHVKDNLEGWGAQSYL